MKTIEQAAIHLKTLGCKTSFKPYLEPESHSLCLCMRKPVQIADGALLGSEIDLYDSSTFRVWTSQARKAHAYAKKYGLKIRLLNGECELFVPIPLADVILRTFGAKVKKVISEEHKAKLKAVGYKKHALDPGSVNFHTSTQGTG